MAKSRNLKAFLESSLNEIFRATVSDILESVEETLSEYQGKIERIETENEDLRRMLQKQDIDHALVKAGEFWGANRDEPIQIKIIKTILWLLTLITALHPSEGDRAARRLFTYLTELPR